MFFNITGGIIRLDKKIFIREMLRPDSVMKHLLNYQLEDQGKTRSLKVDKSSSDQVVIDFNFVDKVAVGEDYQSLLKSLKKELKGKMKGRITLRAEDYYEAVAITLDFNSEDDKITQHF